MMAMMNKYEEKIKKIKNDEAMLLQNAKDAIQYRSILEEDHLKIVKVLEYSEQNAKKYTQLLRAEKLINDLTVELVNTSDMKKMKEIRTKINYYIHKIKKELQVRNVREQDYHQYCKDTSKMKKSISNYVRFMKRENKIKQIDELYSRFDSLSADEFALLKRLLVQEQKYVRNNLEELKKAELPHRLNIEGQKKRKPIVQKKIHFDKPRDKKKKKAVNHVIRFDKPRDKKEKRAVDNVIHFDKPRTQNKAVQKTQLLRISKPVQEKEFHNVDEYLIHRISIMKDQYRIVRTSPYNGSWITNIQKYIRNVPRYLYNKKIIKVMEKDTSVFMKSADLLGFIEYTKKRNSLTEELKKVFSNSSMKKSEEFYLSEQERCVAWIKNFCREKELVILY